MLYIGPGLVVRGDEIWQYGTGYRTTHGDVPAREQRGDGTIFRHVHRVDGFVSLDFTAAGSRAVCGPAKVSGSKLVLNVDTGALGDLRVGLLASNGDPIPGFSVEECDVVRINSTKAEVRWRGRPDLDALLGREVQFEISASRTKLYSLRFE